MNIQEAIKKKKIQEGRKVVQEAQCLTEQFTFAES